jgi:hypothetical protein
MKFLIEWIEIGRNKWSHKEQGEFDDLRHAEWYAYQEADKELLSSNTQLEESENTPGEYYMYAGIRQVGKVRILKI